jgi:hypothetical protein
LNAMGGLAIKETPMVWGKNMIVFTIGLAK